MKTDTSRHTEEVVMLVLARKIETEHKMGERTALDEKVDHIQRDVTELKSDVKRVEAKLDEKVGALDAKVDQKFHALETKMDQKIGALDAKADQRFDTLETKMDQKIGALDAKVDQKFDTLETKVDQKVGALDAKVDQKFDTLETKVDQKVGALDAKVDQKFGALATELAQHRLETEKSFGQVRDEIGKIRLEIRDAFTAFRRDRTGQIAWTIGVVIAAIGGASGLERLFAPRPTPPTHETSGERGETTQRSDNAEADPAQRSQFDHTLPAEQLVRFEWQLPGRGSGSYAATVRQQISVDIVPACAPSVVAGEVKRKDAAA
jgi:Skp family chaperone for outer membrane proteins